MISSSPFFNIRLILLGLVIVGAFTAVLGRLAQLHLVEGPRLAQLAQSNRAAVKVTPARRGVITDVRGNLLAATQPVQQLGVDPMETRPEDAAKLPELARLIGRPVAEVQETWGRRTRPVGEGGLPGEVRPVRWAVLADGLDEATYEAAMALRIKGIYGNRRYQRTYPGERLAAHVLGFINKEGTAVTGVEQWLDFYLRGQDGWTETEKDAHRRELAQFRTREVTAQPGLNVELTLDLMIQHLVEAELRRLATEYNPAGATIIVSEASTGAILALGNYPSFDPNEFWKFPIETHRNRALTDVLEPGSTFKIVPIAGALDLGLVTARSVFDCGIGASNYQGRLVRLPRDSHPHGQLTVAEITAVSSNRGAAQLGMRLGDQRLLRYAHLFGFGQPTELGPMGEVRGTLHPAEKWDGLTISRLPCGYAMNATPMQIHMAMSVMANHGVLMAPHLVRRVFDDRGQPVVEYAPRARHRAVEARTADLMARLLAGVVGEGGTARRAEIKGYEVAGKTGTARKIINGRYSEQNHVASFTGFFPASRPQIVITVVVDDPNLPGDGYGGVVAAPAFKKVAEGIIQYLNIPPVQNGTVVAHEGGARR